MGDEFFEYLEKALQNGYPLLESIKQHEKISELYSKHKDEERFKELLKKYKVEIPDSIWDSE